MKRTVLMIAAVTIAASLTLQRLRQSHRLHAQLQHSSTTCPTSRP